MRRLAMLCLALAVVNCSGNGEDPGTQDTGKVDSAGGDVSIEEDLVTPPLDVAGKDERDAGEDVQMVEEIAPEVEEDQGQPCLCMTSAQCVAFFPDLGPCELVVCNDCECVAQDKADGTVCDDGDACTNNDACAAGVCAGNDACSGECGDNVCDQTEDCESCPEDCGMCPPPICDVNGDCDEGFYCNTGDCASSTGFCTVKPQGCDAVYDPVCGCDGQTHSNACVAAGAGVTVDYPGECAAPGCFGNNMCPPGEYCLFAQCLDQAGVCTLKPEACAKIWAPVCGCDNVTYGNECEAAAAGVSVDYEGECNVNPGFCLDSDMCEAGQYCLKLDCMDAQGVCMPKPEACIALYDPVCGCDGKTYGNACEAAAAGVSMNYQGECGAGPEVCWDNSMCQPTEYCAMDSCDSGLGTCEAKPEMCPMVIDPVCGCNNKTYDNACLAANSGVNVDYKGNCEVQSGCTGNGMCGFDEYCVLEPCEAATGLCAAKPQACPFVWAPVCGCDGETYGNACEAAASGMSVDYLGQCGDGGEE